MAAPLTITQQIRFLFTAVTLCCVLLLNNQVITTYRPAPKNPASKSNSHWQKAPTEKEQTVVKQKVFFEATTSYFILQLAHFSNWLRPEFHAPLLHAPLSRLKTSLVIHFFRLLFAFAIIPNAP